MGLYTSFSEFNQILEKEVNMFQNVFFGIQQFYEKMPLKMFLSILAEILFQNSTNINVGKSS